ncbi:MAG: ester cyclase [Myxococcota bacterium]
MSSLERTDLDVVEAFYRELLSNPAGVTRETFDSVLAPHLVSLPVPPGGEGAEGVWNTLKAFGQMVPDLHWETNEIIEHGNRYTVRGTATGTPVAEFLGVPPTGRGFEIMSIDIVTVEGGRIVHIFHLEDWTGAIAQLTA